MTVLKFASLASKWLIFPKPHNITLSLLGAFSSSLTRHFCSRSNTRAWWRVLLLESNQAVKQSITYEK